MKFLKKIWLGIRFSYAVIRLLLNTKDLSPIFRVKEFLNHKSFQYGINQAKANPVIKQMMQERYLTDKPYDIKELAKLPEGTLGYVFAKHMNHFKLDVVYYPDDISDVQTNDISWIRQRSRETHDVWHCVLGYRPDHLGEMKISAFFLQQILTPLSSVLLAVGFIHATIKKPHLIHPLVDGIIEGWTDAKNAKVMMEVKWEELWEKPISEVRADLNISVEKETYEQEKMSVLEEKRIAEYDEFERLANS